MLMGAVYLYTEDIRATMLIHFLNNAYSFCMMYITSYYYNIKVIVTVNSILMITGALMTIYFIKKDLSFLSLKPFKQGNEVKLLIQFFTTPTIIVSIAICMFIAVFYLVYMGIVK